MAKKSAIEKNLRRMRLVKKYAKKRAELKQIIKNVYLLIKIVFKNDKLLNYNKN